MYNNILVTNILRILKERNMTKSELSHRSGVSISFLSDLTTGKGNPSLKVMEAIASALKEPLPLLLECTDDKTLDTLAGGKAHRSLPLGYVRVSVILPEYRAYIVRKWSDEARKKTQEVGCRNPAKNPNKAPRPKTDPRLLTQSEIESLQREMKEDGVWMMNELARRRNLEK